jgi:hypothetical protein
MPRRDTLISFALGEFAGSSKSSRKKRDSFEAQAGDGEPTEASRAEAGAGANGGAGAALEEHRREAEPAREIEGHVEVRPIGTTQGLKELAQLYKKTGGELGVLERKVHMMLWPVALHFGLYWIRPERESKRPPLVGAFWARSLAEAPLTLGHLYPPSLFKGLLAADIFEFGGMVVDPEFRTTNLMQVLIDTVRLFLFSRRPELVIATPVESLHALYGSIGLRTLGERPVEHPHVPGVKVYLMYGRFKELAEPYFM